MSEVDGYAAGFAERLRSARGEMSQSELLRLLKENGQELRQARLSHYETGRNYPDPPILAALAGALGVSSDWLLGLTDQQLPVADLEERLAAATGEHRINQIMKRLSKDRQHQVIEYAEFLLSQDNNKKKQASALEEWISATEVLSRRFGQHGEKSFREILLAERPDLAEALGIAPEKRAIKD